MGRDQGANADRPQIAVSPAMLPGPSGGVS